MGWRGIWRGCWRCLERWLNEAVRVARGQIAAREGEKVESVE